MRIIVTGTPGTGKSTFSIELAKSLGFEYVDVNKIIKKYKLSEGYDSKRKCKIIDTNKLSKAIIKETKYKDVVIDSHLSHYLPKQYVSLCVVCKCSLKILKKRLQMRKYSQSKIKENLECEIFQIIFNEAHRHNVFVADLDYKKNIKENIDKIKKII